MDQEKGLGSRVGNFFVRWVLFMAAGYFFIMGVWCIKNEEYFGAIMLAFGTVAMLNLFFIFIYPEIKYDRLNKKLKKTGIKTTAEILSVKQTGKYVNEMPYFRLELKYSVHGQEVIKKKFDVLVSYPELGYYSPGSSLELLVDPDNVQNVVFA
ncbi:hypothetical protein [Advenella alkanexedens]|uniref:hypothetical protein n=1 Tax=Advenella alkanexedens TaxID=1481665 RepID=UPI00267593B8|nr:hypothetical protein [Advenella alkanexedens]WKU19513.1 hypothetical protein Q3V95_00235 [Advenella alkanexedens]